MKTLTLKPEIKVFVRPVKEKENSVLLACFVVARYQDGHCEVLKTVYKEVSKEEYESNSHFSSQYFAEKERVLAIAGNVLKNVFQIIKSTFVENRVSPYIDFSFFVSQPTRAPSN